MNRNVIMGAAAGLLLGLGGGTAYVVMTKPAAPPASAHAAADSLAVDSTAIALAGEQSGHVADSASAAAGTVAHADAKTDDAQAKAAQTDSPLPEKVTPPQPKTVAVAPDSTAVRLGRIFGAMKPEDAAVVLAKLDDAEVKMVLFQLTDRKAAEILARFPGERAANLTKTLLANARAR